MSYHKKSRTRSRRIPTNWDAVADWYDGWVGRRGSLHHRKLAIPALMRLLDPQRGGKMIGGNNKHALDNGNLFIRIWDCPGEGLPPM